MKSKTFNFLLIITSLTGYLEWGGNNQLFLFQAEAEILSKLVTDPLSVLHPFTVLPLLGQVLLGFTLFQQHPNKIVTYTAIGSLGLLLLFIFVTGLISMNYKTAGSAIPFIVVAILTIRHYRKSESV